MAILGDATSYSIGAHVGPKLFAKPKSRFFKPQHVAAAHAFYERHGGKAIVIARFVPLVRTFVPVVAGIAGMGYRRFAMFNITGGIGWVASMTLSGYFLGRVFPNLGRHVEKVIIVIVALSVLPMVVEYLKSRARAKQRPAPDRTP
jgi:membrane-associated protein